MANSALVGTLRAILTLDTAQFEQATARVSSSAKAWSKDLKSMGAQATAIGSSLTAGLTLPLAAFGLGASKAAIDFESSFAGVRKTVQATEPQLAALAEQFRNLAKEIPVNVNEINRIGEAAGALGIPQERILEFTKTMAQLGVTTNLTSEQASDAIARIQNIFGAAGQNTDRLASTLVALGNAGASTEREIVEMGQRIAGAGHAIGLTQDQVLSFASTLASVGINAEAGGSTISRVFLKMNDAVAKGGGALEDFAKVAGMTGEQFQKLFRADAAQATVAVVEGLKRLKESGANVNAEIENMVGKSILMKDTLLRLSGAGQLLTDQLNIGKTAWQENTALTEEANKRFETTASQLTLLWNRVKDVGITFGNAMAPAIGVAIAAVDKLIPLIETLGNWFGDLPAPVQAVAVGFGVVVAAIGPLLVLLGSLFTAASSIAAAFTTTGIATTALGALMPALGSAVALLTGPIGLAVGAVVGLGLAWMKWGDDVTGYVSSTYAAVKEWLWDKLEPVLTPIIGLLDSVGKMFSAFGELVGAVAEKTYGAASSWLGEKFTAVFNGMVTVVRTVSETIGGWIGKIPDHLLPLLGPIGAVVLAFRHWDEISRIAQAVYTGVKTYLIDRFTDIVTGIKGKIDAVTGFFRDMHKAVVGNSFVPDMIEGIKREFARLPEVMEHPTSGSTAAVAGMFDTLSGGVLGKMTAMSAALQEKFGGLTSVLEGPLNIVKTFVETKFGEVKTAAVSRIQGMFDDMSGKFTEWGGKIGGLFENFIGGPIGKGFGGLASSLVGGLGSILSGGLTSLFSMAMPFVVEGLSKLGSLIWEGVKKFGGWLGGLFKGEGAKTNDVRDDLKEALGGDVSGQGLEMKIAPFLGDPAIAAAYNQFLTAGNREDVQAAAEILAGVLDIPMLAQGGIAMRPTFGLIGEGGPEAILPLDQLGALLRMPSLVRDQFAPPSVDLSGAAWDNTHMTIQIVPDGQVAAEWVVPFLPGAVRRLGLAGTF